MRSMPPPPHPSPPMGRGGVADAPQRSGDGADEGNEIYCRLHAGEIG